MAAANEKHGAIEASSATWLLARSVLLWSYMCC